MLEAGGQGARERVCQPASCRWLPSPSNCTPPLPGRKPPTMATHTSGTSPTRQSDGPALTQQLTWQEAIHLGIIHPPNQPHELGHHVAVVVGRPECVLRHLLEHQQGRRQRREPEVKGQRPRCQGGSRAAGKYAPPPAWVRASTGQA